MSETIIKVLAKFEAVGLDKIKKDIDSFSAPISLSIDVKENKKLLKEREALQKEFNRIHEKGGTPEEIERLAKRTQNFVQKATQELVRSLSGAGADFSEAILTALENVAEAQEDLENIQKEKKSFESKFDTGPEGDIIEPKNQAGIDELANEGLRILEQTLEGKQKLQEASIKEGQKAGEILKLREKIRKEYGEGADEAIEQAIKEGKANEKLSAILAEHNKRLTEKQKIARLQVLNSAEQAAKQEKINEFKNIETRELNAQSKLQEETNDLLKEKNDLIEEGRKNATPEEAKKIEKVAKAIDSSVESAKSKLDIDKDLNSTQKDLSKSANNVGKAVQKKGNTFGKAAKQVFNYGLAFNVLRRIYRETLTTIRELDKALTEMAIVTTMNRKEAWQLVGSMQALAKETGFTATEIAKINTLFLRQGRSVSEAASLTKVAAQAARIASISGADSANFLTSAVNGFGLAAREVLAVSDRFASIAANSASSYEELAIGLSKFAAQANVAGISMDFAMGLLAKGVETTREAPETIGTALKTVLARMRELTDFGKTLEDGMDISRVEGALRQVGIALREPTGEFRNMESVITELGKSFNNFNKEQQASVAVALAGTRQQSRLIAILSDFDRTLELVNISQTSAGATNAQHTVFMEGLEAATVRMQNAYQTFITTISDTEIIIGIVDKLAEIIEFVTFQFEKLTGSGINLTKIVVGLFAAFKALNLVLGIHSLIIAKKLKLEKLKIFLTNKLIASIIKEISFTNLDNAAKSKGILLTIKQSISNAIASGTFLTLGAAIGAATKALIKFTISLMTNPVTLTLVIIAAAITAVVVAVRNWRKSTEDTTAELEENTRKLAAQNFEIKRSIKNVNNLIEEIKELNNLPFMTDSQKSDLKDLSQRLIDLIGESKLIVIDGIVNLNIEGNRIAIEEFFKEQKDVLEAGREDLLDSIIDLTVKTIKNGVAFEKKVGSIDQTSLNSLNNLLIQEFEAMFDTDLQNDTQVLFANFIQSIIKGAEGVEPLDPDFLNDLLLRRVDLKDFTESTTKEIIEMFEEVSKTLNVSGLTLPEQVEAFNDALLSIEDENVKNILKGYFQDLNFIIEEGLTDQLENFQSFGIRTAEDIQNAFTTLNGNLDILNETREEGLRIAEKEGITAASGIQIAFARLSRTTDDAAQSALFFGIAFKQTNLEVAQGLDRIGSKLENLEKLRKGFLEGTLSATELARMIEDNAILFEDESDIVRFLRGESIDASVFVEKAEQEREAVSRIANAVEILNDATSTSAARFRALQDIAFFGAITRHSSDLSNLTLEQQRYNSSLVRYELMTSLGIKSTEAFNQVLTSQAITMNQSANRTVQALGKIEEDFNSTFKRIMGFEQEDVIEGFNFDDFFEVLEGVVVPKFEALNGLSSTALDFIKNTMSNYQDELNSSFEEFKKLRDRDLAGQKENFDKQKKVYQDYFAALDRLELQRERKVERQDLVKQLSRLEGATDERSRSRALELRRELNQLDEKTAEDTQREARESLFKGFDERYSQLEKQWAKAAKDFISEISLGGSAIGNSFLGIVENSNLLKDIEFKDADGIGTKIKTFTDSLIDLFGENGTLSKMLNFVDDKFTTPPPIPPFVPPPILPRTIPSFVPPPPQATSSVGLSQDLDRISQRSDMLAFAGMSDAFGKIFQPITNSTGEEESFIENVESRAKGGMVDFEGLAMLHGSKSAPEAVLNPAQTQMFIGLRDALEKAKFSSGNNGSVNIENISISTASLNNSQDFKRAGESLADSFKSAIQRKGITVNTNKV